MILKKWFKGLPMPFYFLLLALLLHLLPGFFMAVCRAQGSPPPGQGLAVGQPVPGHLTLEMVNYPHATARLSDFRGKLLILDFYATWCSTSRAPMPRLDSLQQTFGDQLQLLLVSYPAARDNQASVNAFFEKWRTPAGTRYRLPSVVNDTTLVKLFPHRLIPHFAWIKPDGTVGAITGADKVTAAHIRRALAEGIMPPTKKNIDLNVPLFSSNELPAGNMLHYSILLRGAIDGAPSAMRQRQHGDQVTGAVYINQPLLSLYKAVKQNLYPELGNKGLLVEGADSASLFPERSPLPAEEWKARHTYSYDLVLPEGSTANPYQLMLQDLNRYSGYEAMLEPRATDCLLLVRKGRRDKLRSKGGEPANRLFHPGKPSLQNMPLAALVSRLNSNNSLPLLVVNKTNYTNPVDLQFSTGFNDLPALRRELQRYGLDLVPARRKVPVLVLRRKNTDNKPLTSTNH